MFCRSSPSPESILSTTLETGQVVSSTKRVGSRMRWRTTESYDAPWIQESVCSIAHLQPGAPVQMRWSREAVQSCCNPNKSRKHHPRHATSSSRPLFAILCVQKGSSINTVFVSPPPPVSATKQNQICWSIDQRSTDPPGTVAQPARSSFAMAAQIQEAEAHHHYNFSLSRSAIFDFVQGISVHVFCFIMFFMV